MSDEQENKGRRDNQTAVSSWIPNETYRLLNLALIRDDKPKQRFILEKVQELVAKQTDKSLMEAIAKNYIAVLKDMEGVFSLDDFLVRVHNDLLKRKASQVDADAICSVVKELAGGKSGSKEGELEEQTG